MHLLTHRNRLGQTIYLSDLDTISPVFEDDLAPVKTLAAVLGSHIWEPLVQAQFAPISETPCDEAALVDKLRKAGFEVVAMELCRERAQVPLLLNNGTSGEYESADEEIRRDEDKEVDEDEKTSSDEDDDEIASHDEDEKLRRDEDEEIRRDEDGELDAQDEGEAQRVNSGLVADKDVANYPGADNMEVDDVQAGFVETDDVEMRDDIGPDPDPALEGNLLAQPHAAENSPENEEKDDRDETMGKSGRKDAEGDAMMDMDLDGSHFEEAMYQYGKDDQPSDDSASDDESSVAQSVLSLRCEPSTSWKDQRR